MDDVKSVCDWCRQNMLMLNPSNTVVMSVYRIIRCEEWSAHVIIDTSLAFTVHVNNLINDSFRSWVSSLELRVNSQGEPEFNDYTSS